MRVPQEPQNAKPTWTGLPQVGQVVPPAAAGPGPGADSNAGAPVGDVGNRSPAPVTGVCALGDGWNAAAAAGDRTAGILGESFQGMPPLGFGVRARAGSA